MLIPYRNSYNLCFSGGSRPLAPPPPSLDQRMQLLDQLDAVTKVRYEKKFRNEPPWVSLYVYMVSGKTTIGPDQDPNCFSRQKSLGSDNFGSNPLYFTFCIKIYLTCHLPVTFANSLGPDQAGLLFRPDRGPNCLTL